MEVQNVCEKLMIAAEQVPEVQDVREEFMMAI